MKTFFVCLLLFITTSSISLCTGKSYGNFNNVIYNSCYDGDTCRFTIPALHPLIGENIAIRVDGIDTPEIRGKCPFEKVKAKQARDYLRQILSSSKKVNLLNVERGKYFRIVATLEIDGVKISNTLVEQGLAVVYDGGNKTYDWCNRN